MTVIQPLTAINGRVWETKYFIPKQNNMNQKGTVLCLQEAGGGEMPAGLEYFSLLQSLQQAGTGKRVEEQ